MNRIIFMFCVLVLVGTATFGQINAPILYCIKGDTIRWDLPVNTCGAFQSYNIYYATTHSGPYQLLTSIGDASINEYVWLTNPGGNIFFYMTTSADCPGYSELSSDTLDSASPLPAIIESASVTGNAVHLQWQKSDSPETWAYIIYKGFPDGSVQILDTVMGLSYLDTNKAVNDSTYTYYVTAIDRCGGTSIFSAPHTTTLLKGSIDTCSGQITIEFTPYVGLSNPGYYFQVTENGSNPSTITLSSTEPFTYNQTSSQTTYCFTLYVSGTQSSEDIASNSWCIESRENTALDALCLTALKLHSEPGKALFDIATNQNAVLDQLTYKKAASPSELAGLETNPLPDPAPSNNQYLPTNTAQPEFFELIGSDVCGNTSSTGYFNTLALNAIIKPSHEVILNWNALMWEQGHAQSCLLEKIDPSGQRVSIFQGDCKALTYSDQLIAGQDNASQYCYQLTAMMDYDCGQQTYSIPLSSNIACVEKSAGMFVPTAFIPDGVTPVFKPLIYFPESMASFQMIIYDRYGGKIYETNDPEKGWDGQSNHRQLPVGPYGYLIRLVSTNGKVDEKAGSVILLR